MWPFTPQNSQQTPSEQPRDASPQLPAPAAASLEAIAAQLSQLTSDLAGIRLEWAETLDKINRWASRQAARARRQTSEVLDTLASDGSEIAEDAPESTNGNGSDTGSLADRAARKAQLRAQFNRR